MARPDSAPAELHIRCPTIERAIYTAAFVVSPVVVTSWALMSGVPLLHGLIGSAFVMLFLLPFMITAWRFDVRVNHHEIVHREFVTRRIPMEHIERIRVARETRWPVKHTKIEILGDGTRILVSWRSSRMGPLLRFLELQFPSKVHHAESLPDV